MRFEFAAPARMIFGPGALAGIGPLAREFGRHALVVTGRDPRRADRLRQLLADAQLSATVCAIPGEPGTDDIIRGVATARAAGSDVVIGFGGGSAVDAAKAIAGLLANDGDLFDYLEVIGRAQPLARAGVPCIAIPTTAGTGSEVTRNAVLVSPTHRLKVSLRSPHLLSRIALIDPELTYELPPALTASTGLDALTQLIEPYVSTRSNPATDAFCAEGIRRAARSLRSATNDGRNTVAREDMALASLFGGLALANAGLGAVHGFAAPIGGMFPAPHGAVCAALLPFVVAANLRALRLRTPGHDVLRRYDDVARWLTSRGDATADDAVEWLGALVADLPIPKLSQYGLRMADAGPLVKAAKNASSMKANPIALTDEELTEILARAL